LEQPPPSPAAETPEPTPTFIQAPQSRALPKASYNRVQTQQRVVALTFDDGPHPVQTPRLLDLLKERGIRATFYLIGRLVEQYPDITRRIIAEGHEIGNHTWSHPSLTSVSSASVASEIQKTNDAIRKVTGTTPQTMRPPYGATNAAINRRMNDEFNLRVIMWSVDPQDWKFRDAGRISSHILQNTKPGDIILAHDIHASTVAAMPRTLDSLRAQGYRFVTVSELLKLDEG
jgi:peptidoglycan/xylan/chitin deacetylase (PgdA/CDA1 family)